MDETHFIYLPEILPEPEVLKSCFFGFPEYSISPEPFTLDFKASDAYTCIPPEPETVALARSAFRPEASRSPEPVTTPTRSPVLPFRFRSPEPTTFPSTDPASSCRSISPDPVTVASNLSALILSEE